MADDTVLTPLNFHESSMSKAFIDRKMGLKIIFGTLSALPHAMESIAGIVHGFGIAFQAQGMEQNELDMTCRKLITASRAEGIRLLVTKSDLPFDSRWYVTGDIRALIEAARLEKLKIPVSESNYALILEELEHYLDLQGEDEN